MIIRRTLLLNAIFFAFVVNLVFAGTTPIICIMALFPVLVMTTSYPGPILHTMVIATSIEMLKKRELIEDVLDEMKREKTMRTLMLLQTMRSEAKRNQKLHEQETGETTSAPTKELDPAQKMEYKELFDLFDSSGDGHLDQDELAKLLTSLGEEFTDNQLKCWMNEMDIDQSGEIDFEEFCDWRASMQEPDDPEEWGGEIFDEIIEKRKKAGEDMDETQQEEEITVAEFVQLLKGLDSGMTHEEILLGAHSFDPSGDGNIDRDEFVQTVKEMSEMQK